MTISVERVELLMAHFEQNANENDAIQMQAYMKNKFAFYGLKAPIRRAIMRDVFGKRAATREEITALFQKSNRECHIAGVDLAVQEVAKGRLLDIALLEQLITTHSWWDSVDALAVNAVGPLLKKDQKLRESMIKKWQDSDNMWLNRTAIICQLKYKTQLDEGHLEGAILKQIDSSEFFIQKAIGWMLREYAKTKPEYVLSFIKEHPLKPLSKREALRHLGR
jgi:3-methyladenine DNA glycosylase AlkD